MTHASLFSGIGGFDLAAEWAGWSNAFNCEIDPFCRKVLKYHFPNAEQYEDIKSTDFTIWRGKIDVLTGGFPCQPFSTAGKRKGTADNRYLWPEMLRAIREIRPRWVVGENVLGIVSWDGGMVFEQVQLDLEAEGYEVQAYVLPACGVNAPHQRYRTWFVAYCSNTGIKNERKGKNEILSDAAVAYSDSFQLCKRRMYQERSQKTERYTGLCYSFDIWRTWEIFPTQPPVCSRDDGFPIPMDGITFPKWRAESIKAYGNAIVPQVAYRIFDAINKYEML